MRPLPLCGFAADENVRVEAGLRLSEVISVEVDDIVDLGDRGAYIGVRQGKGGRTGTSPGRLALPAAAALHRPSSSGRMPPLFPTTRGDGQPLTPQGRTLLEGLAASARIAASVKICHVRGVDGPPSAHRCRTLHPCYHIY